MMSSYISTLAWTSAARTALPRLQADISKASTELSTGRYADLGLQLGVGTGESVSLHLARAAIEAQTQTNAAASGMIGRSQLALSQITDTANGFLKDVLASRSGNASGAIVQEQARAALTMLTSSLNTSDGQRYLFGGINSGEKPMADYESGPKAAVDAAFAAAFGLNPSDPAADPAVGQISAADMGTFLDGAFAQLFQDPAWGTDWSSASSTPLGMRISESARVPVTTTANTPAMRNLAMAFTMVAELGTQNLSDAARGVLLDKATRLTGTAVSGVTALAAGLGVSQTRINAANDALSRVSTLVDTRINTLEGVDPAEAKTRMDTLTTQLQMSYATTGKIMQLSILNFI